MARDKEEYRGYMEGQDSEVAVRAGEDGQRARAATGRGVVQGVGVSGDGGRDDAREVLLLLPAGFVRWYEVLFFRALGTGEEGHGRQNDEKAKLGKVAGKGARRGKKAGAGRWPVKDERMLAEKERVDRTLRKLARELETRLSSKEDWEKNSSVQCGSELAQEKVRVAAPEGVEQGTLGAGGDGLVLTKKQPGCRKWIEQGWKYCPHCGVAQTQKERDMQNRGRDEKGRDGARRRG